MVLAFGCWTGALWIRANRIAAIVEKTAGYVARNGIVFEGMLELLGCFVAGS